LKSNKFTQYKLSNTLAIKMNGEELIFGWLETNQIRKSLNGTFFC
jgi:hypothetical protein